jgi:hypothetical protein
MNRREFLFLSLAGAVAAALPRVAYGRAPADAGPTAGQATPTTVTLVVEGMT